MITKTNEKFKTEFSRHLEVRTPHQAAGKPVLRATMLVIRVTLVSFPSEISWGLSVFLVVPEPDINAVDVAFKSLQEYLSLLYHGGELTGTGFLLPEPLEGDHRV